MTGNWRALIALTVISWSSYSVILKLVSGRVPWRLSMLLFVIGYAVSVAVYCALSSQGSLFTGAKSVAAWPLICGGLCGLGAIAFFKAIPQAEGNVLYPLVGLYVPLAAVGCIVFLGEPVGLRGIIGIICASAAVVLLGR